MQSDADVQESPATVDRFWLASTTLAADQVAPLNVIPLPLASTAAQNRSVGHDTAVRELPASIAVGVDQVAPLKVIALPLSSTATQNAADWQETEVKELPPSTVVGVDQVEP